ncbi:hypothetical protein HK405_011006, partial [Cladochytrium tenue]
MSGNFANLFVEAHGRLGWQHREALQVCPRVIRAFIRVTGDPKKVGIKLSPAGGFNDMGDPIDLAVEEYAYLIKELDALNIAYILMMLYVADIDPTGMGNKMDVVPAFRPHIKYALCFISGSLTGENAEQLFDPDHPKPFPAIDVAVF